MPGQQGPISGLRGASQGQEGPSKARDGPFESKLGEKHPFFNFWEGTYLTRGRYLANFTHVARGLAAPPQIV